MVAAAAELPVFASDLPVSAHSKLGADLLLQLAADGVLAGLNDSSGDEGGLHNVILRRATGVTSATSACSRAPN